MGKGLFEQLYSRRGYLFATALAALSLFVTIATATQGGWFWIGVFGLVASFGAFTAISVLAVMWPRYRHRKVVKSYYEIGPGEPTDFEKMVDLGRLLVDPDIGDPAHLYKFHDRNPDSLIVIRHVRIQADGTILSRLKGYYVFVPIAEETYRRWFVGATAGLDLRDDEILKDERRAYAVALMTVAAERGPARGHLAQHLLLRVKNLAHRAHVVFTRPITQDGLRFAESYGFREHPDTKLRVPGPLHTLDLATLVNHPRYSRLKIARL